MLRLGEKLILFDGGFGTEAEKAGLTGIPEDWNIEHPETVQAIHRSYEAADCITANSFGLNRIKYTGKYDLRVLAQKAAENARAAGKPVFFDVGPTGRMTAPAGTLSFDDAYAAYAEIADITRNDVDGYIAETFSDLYELKACILALKEHADKPIFATCTFDAAGRTLMGATPEIVANTLSGLGVAALGVNCSLGPKELLPTVERLLRCSPVPVIVQPNRGLPVLRGGKTVYELSQDEFARVMQTFAEMGVSVLGGCCGTTPSFIEALRPLRGKSVPRPAVAPQTMVNSGSRAAVLEGVLVCGERLNPTGKPKLKEALKAENYEYLIDEAVRQQAAGADLLDLNVGLPGIDEARVMETACRKIQEYTDLPLQIDSSNAEAIERGVRYYNGIPLINSVSGDRDVMERIFPIAKKYGAAVLGLTMDSEGVPRTAAARAAIAERIIRTAESYGIPRHKIVIDTLTLTASAEQKLVRETVEALRLVSAMGVKTALGVSNVSFGLPCRPLLNKTFLTMALTCGLNMPILNPMDAEMMAAVKAFNVLSGADENAETYIAAFKDCAALPVITPSAAAKTPESGEAESLYDCVLCGARNKARALTQKELAVRSPMDVIQTILVAALDEVGKRYDAGTLFLPQLMASAEAAKIAFSEVRARLPKGEKGKGKIVRATVKGDVHDIGKNIVKAVAESYGYEVIDLGKDVPAAVVAEAVRMHKPMAVGLSALMTTTVKSMEETIAALKAGGCACPIFAGGAVLTPDVAASIGADGYTRDALGFIKALESL